MSLIGERIKMIRQAQTDKSLRSQEGFGNKLGLAKSSVSNIENGMREPSDTIVNLICKTFNVSESWLRTGEGEMTVPVTRSTQISEFVGSALADRPENDFKRRFLLALSQLDEDGWNALEKMAKAIAAEEKAEP